MDCQESFCLIPNHINELSGLLLPWYVHANGGPFILQQSASSEAELYSMYYTHHVGTLISSYGTT